MTPQHPTILSGVPPILLVLPVKTLVVLRGVSSHFVRPLKVRFILNFLKNLVYWLSEHSTDYLSSIRPRMPRNVSLRSVVIVPIQPEVPSILRDHFNFPLSLLLVLLDPLVLINTVHELTHTPNRFPGQRLPQIVLDKQADLESPYSHVIKIPTYLVEHLLVPVRISFQGLPLSHGHRQQRI